MHIYFSGIGGVGIGPLAEIAFDAGHDVSGSDLHDSLMIGQLQKRGVDVLIGQDGSQIQSVHEKKPLDWLVHTAALPDDHPELLFARENSIRTSKRDELLADIISTKQLRLIAISGTHGKTTTTGMMVWAMKQLNIPISYSVGTTLSYGPSGCFDASSEYFVYECDEFDRNMLHFTPYLSLITSLEHDHVETYPDTNDYRQAFIQFLEQSESGVMWEKDFRFLRTDPRANLDIFDEHVRLSDIQLAGLHVRQNAFLVLQTLTKLLPDLDQKAILEAINSFPGTARRFEKIEKNLYTDYGHHPAEIAATLQLAHEINKEVALVYQPHQNKRQHEVRELYTPDVFSAAKHVYWLPTYLSREDPSQDVLEPRQLADQLDQSKLTYAEMNDSLEDAVKQHVSSGHLVLVMGAGDIDAWLRNTHSVDK